MNRVRLLLVLLLLSPLSLFAQQTINHYVPFSTSNQNMWGPSFAPFSIDQDITLFDVPWNTSFNTGNAMIGSVAGFSFGAALSGAISGVIGSEIGLHGFTTGTVNVDYPIDATVVTPSDNTYDQGDTVVVNTSYTLDPSANIQSFYPSMGEATWDLYFQLGASASATVCVFSCGTFPIIPAFNTGLLTINLVTINANGVSMLSAFGSPPLFSQAFFPYYLPDALGDYGLSGALTIPYVSTTSEINGLELDACGDSTYFNLNLNVFDLIGAMDIPYVSVFFENLAGEQDLFGIATVSWNFFDCSFDANITNNQCFNFDPTVYVSFQFPVPVYYRIVDPSTNAASAWATSSIINFPVGNNLEFQFPCYFETLNITPTYTINGQITNHTYDVVSFDFLMSALAFGFEIPAVQITPAIYVPSICIDFWYPCGAYWFGIDWCSSTQCTPSFTIPAIGWPGVTYSIGPLWETSIPIGSFSYDWFNQTWALEGFQAYAFSPFSMTANVLSANGTATPVACFGGNDGTVSLTFNNVEFPLSYQWTNGATTAALNNVTANAYEALIVDANGCQLLTGATVTQPQQALSVSLQSTDVGCNTGVSNGSIDATLAGGTLPYSYNWNNGSTSEDLANLAVGSYNVTVTDDNGCTTSSSATINAPSDIVQTASVGTIACFNGSDADIFVNTQGGSLPYQFQWSNGAVTEDLVNVIAGNYTLTITDANNCTDIQTYTVTQPNAPLQLSAALTNIPCYNASTGAIDISVTGGTANYSYQWTNANNVLIPVTTQDYTNIPAGSYSITVVDNNGCVATMSNTLTQPLAPISSQPILTNINCFGATTGVINPQITGGTSPYLYAWSNGTNVNQANNLAAGAYSLVVTDIANCTATYNYTLTQPNSALSIALTPSPVACFGNATGSIASSVSGGSAPYSYAWSNGTVNPNLSNGIAGNYTLTVTDNKGCTANNNATITQPIGPLSVALAPLMVDCFGNQTGSINATISGGTAPYASQWNNQNLFIFATQNEDLSNLPIGTYTTQITDAKGCSTTANTTLTQPMALVANSNNTNVLCQGNSTGQIDLSVTGGVNPYQYTWSTGSIGQDVNALAAGGYSVNITDANGCPLTYSTSILEPASLVSVSTYANEVKCFNDSTGYVNTMVNGGVSPYTYAWSTGDNTPNIDQLGAGVYSVTVTDANGCTAFSGAVVSQPNQGLGLSISITQPLCYGYTDGTIQYSISGGTQPYYFNWGNQNNILLNNPSETLDSIAIGDYYFKITDANQCVVDTIVTMTQPTDFTLTNVTTANLCFADSTGAVDLTVSGATQPYTYNWSNGQSTQDLNNVVAGIYTAIVMDSNGCIDSMVTEVTQPTAIQTSFNSINVSCVDQSDGSIALTVIGGSQPYAYQWSNGNTNEDLTDLTSGAYSITITDNQMCTMSLTVVIAESEMPCITPPNTITPNGDLYNDTWVLDNMHLYPEALIQVYNRWGNLLFSSKGTYTPWDGSYRGNPLPSEVYYYIIDLYDISQTKLTGTLTLIR